MTRDQAITDILAECRAQGVTRHAQIAYVLATAQHETGNTFLPVRERGKLARVRHGAYYGRGLVQLTHRANYAKYQQILGLPLVTHPDLALRPEVSTFILVYGMRTGAFTGKRLDDYLTNQKTDFLNARRIVNGLDRAQLIAGYAATWLAHLRRQPIGA